MQQILDRADVGRTAFYAHYRNKEDVLESSFELLFSMLEPWVQRPSPVGVRLFPVRELLEHIGGSGKLVEALRRDGRLEDVWMLCTAHAASMIGRRIEASRAQAATKIPPQAVARMLAGALVEMIRWWLDRPESATPERLDAAFHDFAGRVADDADDLAAFRDRAKEPRVSFESVVRDLK
ncbi:MAG: hypothetical protein WD771_11325 [Gemmatimonadaceae bacterium]